MFFFIKVSNCLLVWNDIHYTWITVGGKRGLAGIVRQVGPVGSIPLQSSLQLV